MNRSEKAKDRMNGLGHLCEYVVSVGALRLREGEATGQKAEVESA
jgi:hypothetical protein